MKFYDGSGSGHIDATILLWNFDSKNGQIYFKQKVNLIFLKLFKI